MAHDEYLATQIMTAPPAQLHLLVIDGAIRFAKQAVLALEASDYEQANNRFVRCRNCVSELITGLDDNQLPEVVTQLKAMFTFVYDRIVRADLNHDAQLVDDALEVLNAHRDTWLRLMELESPQSSIGTPTTASQTPSDTTEWVG